MTKGIAYTDLLIAITNYYNKNQHLRSNPREIRRPATTNDRYSLSISGKQASLPITYQLIRMRTKGESRNRPNIAIYQDHQLDANQGKPKWLSGSTIQQDGKATANARHRCTSVSGYYHAMV
ncbi:hypothetical protein BFJ70_g2377 [Fusarium oxysporum]|nr:hypothetical protein BFJ70_g2377 [Fusarium oxysporum]